VDDINAMSLLTKIFNWMIFDVCLQRHADQRWFEWSQN